MECIVGAPWVRFYAASNLALRAQGGFDWYDRVQALWGAGNSRTERLARRKPTFAAHDGTSPLGLAGIRAAGRLAVRYGSDSAQCRAMTRGQSTARNGAAADEGLASSCVPRSPPAHPFAQAAKAPYCSGGVRHKAADDVPDLERDTGKHRPDLACRAKAPTADVFDFSFLPRQFDLAQMVADSAGSSTSFISPIRPSALPRSRCGGDQSRRKWVLHVRCLRSS